MDISSKNKKIFLLSLIISAFVFMFYVGNITAYASSVSTSADFMDKFQAFFTGFGLLTSIAIFRYHFCRLSATASNPQQRAEVLRNLLITGVCTSLLGAVPLIVILLFHSTKWE